MAQEREKTRIVLASILKPVDDTRMAGKLGKTLAVAGYDVSIIGFASASPMTDGLAYYPIGEFPRLGLRRYAARWRVFHRAFSCRPDIFIFSTYELIFPALLLKVMLGTRIVYDVRENYYRNIRNSEGLPSLLRWPLAIIVRGLEKITAPMIDHFFLAEHGYDKEFRFHRGGWTLLENKALLSPGTRATVLNGINLLFSGTLSHSTGVFQAMQLAVQLHDVAPDAPVTLTVAGYAAVGATQKEIREFAAKFPFIRLVGIEHLVPHAEIVKLIEQSNAGIVAYHRLPHTVASVPTKLFEYLQASLPIITEEEWPWVARFARYKPFVFTDFNRIDAAGVLKALRNTSFYPEPPEDTGWRSEEPRLLAALKNIV